LFREPRQLAVELVVKLDGDRRHGGFLLSQTTAGAREFGEAVLRAAYAAVYPAWLTEDAVNPAGRRFP
jgi:hypothetical protein